MHPKWFETTSIVPIPKKGELDVISNYRGIALQSFVPKALDKIITKELKDHLRDIIRSHQHGSTKSKNTKELRRGNLVGAIYLDYTKVFDCVDQEYWHQSLLKTPHHLESPIHLEIRWANYQWKFCYWIFGSARIVLRADPIQCYDMGQHITIIILTLNFKKTYHVQYNSKRELKFSSYYYIHSDRIHKAQEAREFDRCERPTSTSSILHKYLFAVHLTLVWRIV